VNDFQKARAVLERWMRDPVAMVVEELGVEPDLFQVDLLRSYARPDINRIALKSCKGPGKTAGLAWCALNFLVTRGLLFPDKNTKIGATSITGDNIDANLWPEMDKWIQRSEFLKGTLRWTASKVFLKTRPTQVFAERRTWAKRANAEEQADALAGLHADFVMFLLDESGGIAQAVMVTAEAVLATEGQQAKIIQAGNPTHVTGPLHRACTQDRDLWHVITITGDPDNPRRSKRISLQWARDQIRQYGRDNPWVLVNVFGEFPPASIDALLGVEEVEAAMARHLTPDRYNWAQKRLGIDVARFGDDLTVIFPRQGRAAFRPRAMRHARNSAASVDIATAIIRAKTSWLSEVEFIDATGGWAAGARDVMLDGGYPVHEVQFAAPALDQRYKNRRAEMWLGMAKWVQNGGALPNMPELVPELTVPTYTFRNGQFVLEEKEQIKERLGRSPNYADALATTFALPEMPAALITSLRTSGHAEHDGDPFPSADRDGDPWK